MARGLFITVEGGDGSGKTTQLDFLRDYLAERGEKVLFTREPGGTAIGEKIREVILDRDHPEMDAMTEALLYAASRAQIVAEVIRPALARGETVVCDRYVDSSLVYQGYARGLGESVEQINSFVVDGVMPDLTILLKVAPEKSRERLAARARAVLTEQETEADRIESAGDAFHRKVYEGYLALEEKYPDRIVGIDGSRSVSEVSAQIAAFLDRLLAARERTETE